MNKGKQRNKWNGVISSKLGKNERLGVLSYRWQGEIEGGYQEVMVLNRSGNPITGHWVGKIYLN